MLPRKASGCLAAAIALFATSVVQAGEPGTLDGTDMDEGVLAAIVRLNEAKTFLAVEPFHGSPHGRPFRSWICADSPPLAGRGDRRNRT